MERDIMAREKAEKSAQKKRKLYERIFKRDDSKKI